MLITELQYRCEEYQMWLGAFFDYRNVKKLKFVCVRVLSLYLQYIWDSDPNLVSCVISCICEIILEKLGSWEKKTTFFFNKEKFRTLVLEHTLLMLLSPFRSSRNMLVHIFTVKMDYRWDGLACKCISKNTIFKLIYYLLTSCKLMHCAAKIFSICARRSVF